MSVVHLKLVYTGALRAQLLSGSRAQAAIAVFRQSGPAKTQIDAAEDTELLPGDVVEIALKPDPAMRGVGDGAGVNGTDLSSSLSQAASSDAPAVAATAVPAILMKRRRSFRRRSAMSNTSRSVSRSIIGYPL